METSIQSFIEICKWDTSQFLILSNNVFGTLIYYSHFSALILSLSIGLFVFYRDRKALLSQLLFLITVLFSVWIFFDLVVWATEKPQYTMFFWSVMVFVEPLIYALCVYFIDVFINKKDISFKKKLGIFLPLLPIIILLPTSFVLQGFDLSNCYRDVTEGFIATYYVYLIEIIYAFWILFFIFNEHRKATQEIKRQIVFIGIGIIMFLISFVSGNIVGSLTDNWVVAQIGLFGMPVFVGFLAYMIVRFKTFNIKLFGAQVLVVALGFLVLVISFVRDIENVKLIVAFTLLFVLILGRTLIKSVKREVEQRERLEVLRMKLEESNLKLENANDKLKDLDKLKTEFLSLASHQLRSPLTAIKGYTSMVLDGDFGEINSKAKDAIERVFQSTMNLTKVVEDLLNVSKIEQGGLKFVMEPFNLTEVASDMSKDLSISAEKKGVKLSFESSDNECMVNGDKEKIRQVVLNLVDNSIKYTKEGTIVVSVKKADNKIVFAVKDTGMGMTPEIKATLFQKFARGEGSRMNTGGSGLGLYLAKEIIEAHKGTIDVDSEGMGKGSTFHFELGAI